MKSSTYTGSLILLLLSCTQERLPLPAPVPSVVVMPPPPQKQTVSNARDRRDATPAAAATKSACPSDMVLVEGNACSNVQQDCVEWLDDPKLPYARCAAYSRNSTCIGTRKRLRFCIDRDELTLPGERVPASDLSFVKASKLCKDRGRRMCAGSEWTFACEGEEMRPYPYGWERKPVCNQDRDGLLGGSRQATLADQRAPSDAFPECVSPFGVRNMVGNVDELVARDKFYDPRFRNLLKGGWWMPARNRCRPATADHDDYFHELQIGTRCCADASEQSLAPRAQN